MTLNDFYAQGEGGLSPLLYSTLVEAALREDLASTGDLTTELIFDPQHRTSAVFTARDSGVVAGLGPALRAFFILDSQVEVSSFVRDGQEVKGGTVIARISGSTRALLTGERTALNLWGHLSGIATKTRAFVRLVEGSSTSIADTRKTLPGLRALQKYAVRVGGGKNHRMNLADCVLIKDNHIAACGSLSEAVGRIRQHLGHTVKIELEVDTLRQFEEALKLEVDIVLLDNFSLENLKQAVHLRNVEKSPLLLETSGRVTEETVRSIAQTGVDIISVGALTHSVKNFDIGLDYE